MAKKASPGLPVILSAREYNTSLEVNDAWRRGLLGGPHEIATGPPLDTNKILVLNNTGGDREFGDIVGIGSPLYLPSVDANEFLSKVVVSGETPSAAYVGKLAMLLEPLAQQKIGWAAMGGVWNTIIYVDHEQQEWATYDGNDQFRSQWYGDAQILWKESGTGEKNATLRLGHFFDGLIDGVTNEAVAPGSSGNVTIWYGGAVTSPASIRVGHLVWTHGGEEIKANTQVSLRYDRKQEKLIFRHANCKPEGA